MTKTSETPIVTAIADGFYGGVYKTKGQTFAVHPGFKSNWTEPAGGKGQTSPSEQESLSEILKPVIPVLEDPDQPLPTFHPTIEVPQDDGPIKATKSAGADGKLTALTGAGNNSDPAKAAKPQLSDVMDRSLTKTTAGRGNAKRGGEDLV